MTARPETDRQTIRADLQNRLENGPKVFTGRELAQTLPPWGFERTFPTGEWTSGPSYWVHSRYHNLQFPIPTVGIVHPSVAEIVLSMVNSVLVHEPVPPAAEPPRS